MENSQKNSSNNLILVVDDDDAILDFIELVVSKTEYRIHRAINFETGIRLINTQKYALIILDILLGKEETSHGIIGHIRNNKEGLNNNTPLMVMSAFMDDNYAGRIKEKCENIVYTLKKPFKRGDFQRAIESSGLEISKAAPEEKSESDVHSVRISGQGEQKGADHLTLHGKRERLDDESYRVSGEGENLDEERHFVEGQGEDLDQERHFVEGQREDLDEESQRIQGKNSEGEDENIVLKGMKEDLSQDEKMTVSGKGEDEETEERYLVKGEREDASDKQKYMLKRLGETSEGDPSGFGKVKQEDAKTTDKTVESDPDSHRDEILEELEDYDFSDFDDMLGETEKEKKGKDENVLDADYQQKVPLKKTALTMGGGGRYGSKITFDDQDLVTSDYKKKKKAKKKKR